LITRCQNLLYSSVLPGQIKVLRGGFFKHKSLSYHHAVPTCMILKYYVAMRLNRHSYISLSSVF
jgi:hypothetical protein